MKVRLVFVPPGGGEADYSLDFDLPSAPQPGDYISIMRPNQQGTEDFIARRTWWALNYPGSEAHYTSERPGPVGGLQTDGVAVECEFALGHYSSENHKQACEGYRRSGKPLKEFEASAY